MKTLIELSTVYHKRGYEIVVKYWQDEDKGICKQHGLERKILVAGTEIKNVVRFTVIYITMGAMWSSSIRKSTSKVNGAGKVM